MSEALIIWKEGYRNIQPNDIPRTELEIGNLSKPYRAKAE
jgi:hypothetical protein